MTLMAAPGIRNLSHFTDASAGGSMLAVARKCTLAACGQSMASVVGYGSRCEDCVYTPSLGGGTITLVQYAAFCTPSWLSL